MVTRFSAQPTKRTIPTMTNTMSEFATGTTFLSGATVAIVGAGYSIDVAEIDGQIVVGISVRSSDGHEQPSVHVAYANGHEPPMCHTHSQYKRISVVAGPKLQEIVEKFHGD